MLPLFPLLAVSLLLFSPLSFGETQSMQTLPRLAAPPGIDGNIHETEWKGALYLGKITPSDASDPLPDTEAWIAMDATHFYIAVRSAEPLPDKIKSETLADEIKGSVWNDDSIEVLLDVGNTGKSIHQLIANTEGTLYDAHVINLRQAPAGWDSGAMARTRIGKSGWEMEISIPMQPMGHQITAGEVVSLNIGRNRYAGGIRQQGSYAGPNFIFPKYFLPLLISGPIQAGEISFVSLKRGPFLTATAGIWEFKVTQGEIDPRKLEIIFPRDVSSPITLPPIKPGQRYITIPIPAGHESAMNLCTVRYEGTTIYSSAYDVQEPRHADRIAKTVAPLFSELVEPRPEGLSKEGIINWSHELERPLMKVVPFRSGMAYQQDTTPYREYQRDRTTLLGTLGTWKQSTAALERSKDYGISWLGYLRGENAAAKAGAPLFGKPGARQYPWDLDPRAVRTYLDEAHEIIALSKKYPQIKGMFAGDEKWERMHSTLLYALDQRDAYPELLAADREIREKHGFGKYGLPTSSTDTNPFRWIATYRWEIEKMGEMAAAVKDLIRTEAPHMKFLSWDSMTGHRPYGVGHWGKYFDIVTAQIYPASNVNRDHVGFTTKFYADLSGAQEIWPVPHIGHFPASFTAEEVEEILSQVFRAGGTGLHLWTSDYRNETLRQAGTSINDRIGAPERWNVVRSVIKRLEEPFRVKQPAPDTAIFYSNTSYQGTGMPKTFSKDNQCEWLYTLLGPKLRSALRFIDDISTPRDPESLLQYKVIYIPYMPIADDPEYDALQAYVEKGGTLVVCDPLAFRHRSDGSQRSSGAILPPLAQPDPQEPKALISLLEAQPAELRALSPAYSLERAQGQTPLANYSDGHPAVVETVMGKGKVIYFGEDPMVANIVSDPSWLHFFDALQKRSGASKGHDVWRFRFPSPPKWVAKRPEGMCLTGNYFEWSLSEPKPMANSAIGGFYRLNGVQTKKAEPIDQEISFQEGRLHDRMKGASAPNAAAARDFILECTAAEPWAINYHFNQPVNAGTLRLFYSGTLPGGWCEISTDGENWTKAGAWKTTSVPGKHDVGVQVVSLSATKAPHLKLHFDPTEKAGFSLVEVDIWGAQ